MELESLFQIVNAVALVGWVSLLCALFVTARGFERLANALVPGLLAVVYTGLILAFWSRSEGGFGSLAAVDALFQSRELLLAGWIHYLAFDLLIGAWIVRTSQAEGLSRWWVIPCLAFTFLFGPVGFLLFAGLRVGQCFFLHAQPIKLCAGES